jgi:flavin-dependent dehydrogenase
MFADTITFTINSVAKVLSKINQDKYSSEYLLRETGGEFRARIRHSSFVDKTRAVTVDRHNVELTQVVYADGTSPQINRKAYMVFENDNRDDATSSQKFASGMAAFMSDANALKLVNWES